MIYIDKNNKEIKDADVLLFSHPDRQEPSGFNKYATDVKLCFWSDIENRYIPFAENYDHSFIEECERINLKTLPAK